MRKAQLSEGKDPKLENHPRFLARIEAARQSLRQGRGVRLEDVGVRARPARYPGKQRRR